MTWRLEPQPRNEGIEEGLAARTHDGLWLLARQWQLGEFHARDAGTPTLLRVLGESHRVNAWRGAGAAAWQPLDPAAAPLDALVEPETRTQPSLRERLEAGAQFELELTAAGLARYLPAFRTAAPFPDADLADPAFTADPLLASTARRRPDGLALLPVLASFDGGGAPVVPIDAGDLVAFNGARSAWSTWYGAEIEPQPGIGTALSWQESRLEYGLAVSSDAAGGAVLTAEAYHGDGLDWFDFDIDSSAAAAAGAGPALSIERKAVPTPLRYGGMPLPRFWAMEDAQVDFGSVDASAADLGRLLLVEFATVYGNNWYVQPLHLPDSSLTLLSTVLVTDSFGRQLLCTRANDAQPQWRLFALDTTPGQAAHAAQGALFLPPSSTGVQQGESIETVQFFRDEMADLVFAVEARVEDSLGRGIDRRTQWQAPPPPRVPAPGLPIYRVETTVPDYWLPLAPEKLAGQNSVRLRLSPLEVIVNGSPVLNLPLGAMLNSRVDGQRLWVHEAEVPRQGMRLDRLHRLVRWHDGQTQLWTARLRQVGRGEGSSGLRFDALLPGQPGP